MMRGLALFLAFCLIATSGLASYRDKVSGEESNGNYAVFNQSGHTQALGRYQFLPSSFASQGYMTYSGGSKSSWSSYSFNDKAQAAGVSSLADLRYSEAGHSLQDAAFDRFTASNWASLSQSTRALVGSSVSGAPITQDGLLSTAHFLGAGGAEQWVQSGFDAHALPFEVVTANGFSSYAELQDYLMQRMSRAAGSSWDGGSGTIPVGQDGPATGSQGFPGLTASRPIMIHEIPPFQGVRPDLTLGGSQ